MLFAGLTWSQRVTFAAETHSGVLSIFSGAQAAGFADGPLNVARFNSTKQIAFDETQNLLFVVDGGNFLIRRIDVG